MSARIVGRRLSVHVFCVALLVGGCAPTPNPNRDSDPGETSTIGLASWYSDALNGRTTASGEPYDRTALTAAHRELPFGTQVRVTRVSTGRSVVVRINDRGPFVEGRIVDLSRRAAERLGMIDAGVVRVRLSVLD